MQQAVVPVPELSVVTELMTVFREAAGVLGVGRVGGELVLRDTSDGGGEGGGVSGAP